MRNELKLLFVLGAVSCTPALNLQPHDDQYEVCGRRAVTTSHTEGSDGVVGKVRQIVDSTQSDGPVQIIVIDPRGDMRRLYFGSLYTRPAPSEQRLATYQAIASLKIGDCVRADGKLMSDGKLWIEAFADFDHP